MASGAALIEPTLRVIEAATIVKQANQAIEMSGGSLTVTQISLLQFIAENGGSIDRMASLAEAMAVTPNVITGIVDRLVRDGYVRRSQGSDQGDRRAKTIEITDEGWNALRWAQGVIAGMT